MTPITNAALDKLGFELNPGYIGGKLRVKTQFGMDYIHVHFWYPYWEIAYAGKLMGRDWSIEKIATLIELVRVP